MSKFLALYRRTLVYSLNHRWKVVFGAILFFIASLGITKSLNKEFLPPEDQSRFMIRFLTPVGSSLETTNSKILEAEAMLKEFPEIKTFFVPGSSVLSSHFDVARTVCRRAERCIVRLSEQSVGETPADVRVLSPHSLSYLNRLSSLLYALARFVAHTQGLVESAPQYK
jgi:multidrug efflux pump subunit AcrB